MSACPVCDTKLRTAINGQIKKWLSNCPNKHYNCVTTLVNWKSVLVGEAYFIQDKYWFHVEYKDNKPYNYKLVEEIDNDFKVLIDIHPVHFPKFDPKNIKAIIPKLEMFAVFS